MSYRKVRRALITGVAVLIPAVASVYILYFALRFIFGLLTPFISVMRNLPFVGQFPKIALGGVTVFIFVFFAFLIGLATQSNLGRRAVSDFDLMMENIPIVGVMYESFRKLSNVLLEEKSQQFREVKVIEFPEEDIYTIGFETTKTPSPIHDAVMELRMNSNEDESETETPGTTEADTKIDNPETENRYGTTEENDKEDFVTLFLPLAPNPFIGGFLVHVPEEHVQDVDMSVEEGIATVLTVGVGTSDSSAVTPLSTFGEFETVDKISEDDK